LADARNRAQALANAARDEQRAKADARRKELEGQLDVKLADAEKTIAGTKAAAMGNVRGIAVDVAGAIVKRLIGKEPPAETVTAAVGDTLKR
jgi:F-type H+-transporting ATPase subunit b